MDDSRGNTDPQNDTLESAAMEVPNADGAATAPAREPKPQKPEPQKSEPRKAHAMFRGNTDPQNDN